MVVMTSCENTLSLSNGVYQSGWVIIQFFCGYYREIGRMDPRDLARDTSGTRAYADFLVELAGRVPSQIIPNISVLLCHLDGEVQ